VQESVHRAERHRLGIIAVFHQEVVEFLDLLVGERRKPQWGIRRGKQAEMVDVRLP
jgi:hypothetical protein